VESIINRHPLVAESAAIGVPHPVKGEEVVVFCVLNSGIQPAEKLRETLMNEVASELGKPLQPKVLRFVQALPKTRNAKIMHRIIRSVYLGKETGDLSSLEDPSTLEAIRESV
jgi:acetyl-CoA synthetase